MKRNSLLKGVVISTALSAILTGCGSINSAIEDIQNDIIQEVQQSSIKGKAIDGYLQYATVCLDINADGYCQQVEPHSQTAADGSFTLQIEQTHRDQANFDEALLLVFGGVDVDTGKDFRGKLYAPNDGSELLNVSPITTLVAKNLEKEIKNKELTREQIKERIKEAKAKVAQALEIKEDEIGLDPVAFQKEKQDDKLIRKALKVQKSIEALMFAAGVDDSEKKEKIEEIYEALAEGLEDMGEEEGLAKLFEKAAEKEQFKNMFQEQDRQSMLALTDAITENLDTVFDAFEIDDDQLKKIAAVTEETFADIEEGIESAQPDFISGIVFLEDDERLKPQYDWLAAYIEQDLKAIGIRPTVPLVNKLKALYRNEIRAGVLLEKAEELKDNSDAELRAVYKRILEMRQKVQDRKEAEEARYDQPAGVDLKALIAGKTFYAVERSVECEVSMDSLFEKNCQAYFDINKIEINADATAATDDDGETSRLQIEGNNIFVITDEERFVLTFKADEEKYIELYLGNGEKIKLFKDVNEAENYLQENESEESSAKTDTPEAGDSELSPL